MLTFRPMNWKRMLSCEKSVDSSHSASRTHAGLVVPNALMRQSSMGNRSVESLGPCHIRID